LAGNQTDNKLDPLKNNEKNIGIGIERKKYR
jgi:hypothetical protein